MESALLRNMLGEIDLRELDASGYDGKYADNDGDALDEVHEFPDSTEPEVSEKKEVTKVQSQLQVPIFNRIRTSKPASYNDAPEIGNSLRDNIPVIPNLNYTGKPEGQHTINFVSGLYFGSEEKLELVGGNLFLLVPKGIATATDQK